MMARSASSAGVCWNDTETLRRTSVETTMLMPASRAIAIRRERASASTAVTLTRLLDAPAPLLGDNSGTFGSEGAETIGRACSNPGSVDGICGTPVGGARRARPKLIGTETPPSTDHATLRDACDSSGTTTDLKLVEPRISALS